METQGTRETTLPRPPDGAGRGRESGVRLLISDIDGTLLGDEVALARLAAVLRSSPLQLALNSSRPRASVEATLRSLGTLIEPVALISAMGTEISVGGQLLQDWAARFAVFDRRPIDAALARLGFRPHAAELQTALKASFTVPAGEPLARAREAIAATGIPVALVHSGASNLDVLPAGAGKGAATQHLTRALGHGAESIVVAGDSGNDIEMFEAAERGIVVGNADAALRAAVDPSRAYLARQGFAAGILEGLEYWGVIRAREEAP